MKHPSLSRLSGDGMVSLPAGLASLKLREGVAGRFYLAKKIKFTDEFLVPICFP